MHKIRYRKSIPKITYIIYFQLYSHIYNLHLSTFNKNKILNHENNNNYN